MLAAAQKPIQAAFGPYQVVRSLGEGGMGQVFLATHQTTSKQAVVKLMHNHLASAPKARAQFANEARLMGRFRHPYAVALLDCAGVNEARPYLVMEYVAGVSLETLLKGHRRLTPTRAGALLGPLCVVLHAAHGQAILHRDLTADNLMILDAGTEQQSIKVMDFGLARSSGFFLAADRLQGESNSVGGGTPDYLCPEQLRGDAVDARSDLYSVGVLLFKMLTGHLPFERKADIAQILTAHLNEEPPTFADFGVNDVPPAIEAVVRRCLAKFPAERPASAQALAEAFGAALGAPIVEPGAFAQNDAESTGDRSSPFDASAVIERFEAWMPEQVAAMKLRGFIQDVGGVVAASEPGVIRVRLLDPTTPPSALRKGFFGWLKSHVAAEPSVETIELHMQNRLQSSRSIVEITVVRLARPNESADERVARRAFCAQVCRELHAYVM